MQVEIGDYPADGLLPRQSKVVISSDDIWSLDITLAMIIHPALVRFRRDLQSSSGRMAARASLSEMHWPQLTFDFYEESDGLVYDTMRKQWEDTLDAMIWSFEQLINPECLLDLHPDLHDEYRMRVQHGLDLFGKHYLELWM